MKTLMVLMAVGEGERRGRVFEGDLSRFDGACINGDNEDLWEQVYPLIFGVDDYIHNDWAVGADCTALINAKEWDVMIFVDDYSQVVRLKPFHGRDGFGVKTERDKII